MLLGPNLSLLANREMRDTLWRRDSERVLAGSPNPFVGGYLGVSCVVHTSSGSREMRHSMLEPASKPVRSWQEIAEEIARETDFGKMIDLTSELLRALPGEPEQPIANKIATAQCA